MSGFQSTGRDRSKGRGLPTPRMAIAIQVEVENGPDDESREGASAQITTESCSTGKEDSGVP